MTSSRKLKKLLASGFTVFSDHQVNPSSEVLALLQCENLDIHRVVLPVSYQGSFVTLQNEIEIHQPDFILMLGLAFNRNQICLEKVAINLADADLPDNDGHKKLDEFIMSQGQAAIFNSLPLRNWKEKIQDPKLAISHSAGSYVCNYLYYSCLQTNPKLPSLFVHLPPDSPQGIDLLEQSKLLNNLLTHIATYLNG